MKRILDYTLILLLTLIAGSSMAQDSATGPDFKLWFANNVTDVQDFDKITSPDCGLNWREVHDRDIDGNSAEVDRVLQMLASTGMKGLEQQQQFWIMRDRTLLCFRIEDADPSNPDSYEVSVKETDTGLEQTKTEPSSSSKQDVKEREKLIQAGKCPTCKGMGKTPDGRYTCSACNGTGKYNG